MFFFILVLVEFSSWMPLHRTFSVSSHLLLLSLKVGNWYTEIFFKIIFALLNYFIRCTQNCISVLQMGLCNRFWLFKHTMVGYRKGEFSSSQLMTQLENYKVVTCQVFGRPYDGKPRKFLIIIFISNIIINCIFSNNWKGRIIQIILYTI